MQKIKSIAAGLYLGIAAFRLTSVTANNSHASLLNTEVEANLSILCGNVFIGTQFTSPQTVGIGVNSAES